MTLPAHKALEGLATGMNWLVRHPFATIAFGGLLVTFPLIIFGLPMVSDDALGHTLYYEHFSDQFWSGDLYPRWSYKMNGGLGGPTFFFYPPLVYYVTSVFAPLQLSSWHQLGLTAALGTVLAGITAFLWLREISTSGSAMAGAVAYFLLPYPVGYDMYGRAALAESFAFVLTPLVLFFVVRIAQGKRLSFLGLAVSYAALCTTHLPTTMMFSAIPVAYALHLAHGNGLLRVASTTLAAMALGVGLSAVYLLPAMAYQDYVFSHELREGHFFFASHLLTRQLHILGSMRYFWFALEVSIVASACFLTARLTLFGRRLNELSFWGMIFLISLFMMTYLSHGVWSSISSLQMVQFPWRFNTILSIASLPIIALAVSSVRSPVRWPLLFLIIAFAGGGYWVYQTGRIEKDALLLPVPQGKLDYIADLHRSRQDWHAFWPKTVPDGVYDLNKSLPRIPRNPDEDGPAKAYFASGSGTININRWQPRDIELTVDASTPAEVNVSQLFFPGWRARISGSAEDLPIRATADMGLTQITVPPGRNTVQLTLEKLGPEVTGWSISILSALVALAIFFGFRLPFKDRSNQSKA